MACEVNFEGDATLISVHGREGLLLPYTKFVKGSTNRETQVDISSAIIYIEIPKINLRKRLVVNPSDALGLLIKLIRAEVETLPTVPCDFIVIDETTDIPNVEWEGKIVRTGYVGQPGV